MNVENIALVRATNIIPFDGVIRPISNVPYLVKNVSVEFSSRLGDLLCELGIIPPLDESKMFDENYYDEMVALHSKILKEYIPYISDYNSMVLFSLNGLCPDDNENGFANNTFSNKSCAVIEPLKYHLDNLISLVPTDTAIKGNVELSNEAIILISKDRFDTLTVKEKEQLKNLNLIVKVFEGSIKDAIFEELSNSGIYVPETLSLSSSSGGFVQSKTSEMQKEYLKQLSIELGVTGMKYFNLITSRDINVPKYNEFENEYNNMIYVQDYYIKLFVRELLNHFDASNYLKQRVDKIHSSQYIGELMEFIKSIGIVEYKNFVNNYNKLLKGSMLDGTLETPMDVVGYSESRKNL